MSEQIMEFLPWIVTYCLLAAGLVGAFIPVIPSHLLILIGGGAHFWMLEDESGLGWVSITVLAVLLIASQTFEWISGSLGARWFGGGKWGTIGAIVGVMVGLFFPPVGFIIGPLVGALLLEKIFGKKTFKEATSSGVGSAVGTLSGLLIRLIVAFVMVIYVLVDIYLLK